MKNEPMTIGLDPGLILGLLLGAVAMIGLSLHHRIWSARKDRIHIEADAFSGGIDRRD